MFLSPVDLVEWCQRSAIGEAVRGSLWLFPAVEAVHLLGFAMLGGAVLTINLRLMDWTLRDVPVARLGRSTGRWTIAGLLVMLASGFVLFTSEAEKMYGNRAFRTKMTLLLAAVLFTLTVHRSVVRTANGCVRPVWRRVAAVVSLVLWTGVGLAGRAIGIF